MTKQINATPKQNETIKMLLAGKLLGYRRVAQNVHNVNFEQFENGSIWIAFTYEWFVRPGTWCATIGKRGGIKVVKS